MPVLHLVRGAPPVRSWSKYQTSVPEWTLCGIRRVAGGKGDPAQITEDATQVNCRYCAMLMRTTTPNAASGASQKLATTAD